jgi:hypothetical protein
MSFAEYQTADRRLVLLKALESAAQYRANAYLLRRFADSLGHVVSADRIEQDLAWLAEQGLVTVEKTLEVTVATLTARGQDVATGRARVPGVQQPAPGG